jgi:hypothetical protein
MMGAILVGLAVFAIALVVCSKGFGDRTEAGQTVHNATDDHVIVYVVDSDGTEYPVVWLAAGWTRDVSGVCGGEMVARDAEGHLISRQVQTREGPQPFIEECDLPTWEIEPVASPAG